MSKVDEESPLRFTHRQILLIEVICRFHLKESQNEAAKRDSRALLLRINPKALKPTQKPRRLKRFYGIRKPRTPTAGAY